MLSSCQFLRAKGRKDGCFATTAWSDPQLANTGRYAACQLIIPQHQFFQTSMANKAGGISPVNPESLLRNTFNLLRLEKLAGKRPFT
jgi:hypothetical protein